MKSSVSKRRGGFTLIELLAVITIIVILAALVVAGMGFAKDKQANSKAAIQLALLEKALNEYKLDNGSYPASTSPDGKGQSNLLYRALYQDAVDDTTKAKTIYLAELDPATKNQGWVSGTGAAATIRDPWGQEYLYRTGAAAENPDFDLWSMGKDGKTGADAKSSDSRDDIRP
jgi:general secretion pathway protein G